MPESKRDRILLVDDDAMVLEMLKDIFSEEYEIVAVSSGQAAIEAAETYDDFAAVVMDIKMAKMDGITAARRIREIRPEAPIIFHTGHPGEYDESEIDDTEQPFDYVQKGKSVQRLIRSVRNAVESYSLRLDNKMLCQISEQRYGMIGRSTAMQAVFQLIRKASPNDNKVMILGESGTGKELVARAIHAGSRRAEKPFAILNCNHKAHDIIEAELFGNVKGAFTGADHDRVGLFEYADKGTVFLDEIGDLDLATQTKLLRVLETGEYVKLGSPAVRRTDVRVLCATHRDLEGMVEESRFRDDLLFRLKGITISLPPLRERKEDIPLLVERFTSQFTVEQGLPPKLFDNAAINVLLQHDWPGNVRQLLETVESLIVLSDSDIIFADDVTKHLKFTLITSPDSSRRLSDKLKEVERTLIIGALAEAKYNVSKAARLLEIDRANLHKKIRLHAIDLSTLRE